MKKIYRFLLIIFTLLCYLSVFVSPGDFWLSGFFSMAIPLWLLFHLIMIILHIKRLGRLSFYLILLLCGYPFLRMTFQLSKTEKSGNSFEILSYNVRVFNNYKHLQKDESSAEEMIKWAVANEAPVKCFQEFYNHNDSEVYNVKEKLEKSGWKFINQRIRFKDRAGAEFGQAIFSKYPIVKSGEVKDESGEFMNTIFSDLLIENDTVRVYCMHLQSMSIDENNIVDTDRLKNSYIDTGYRLKSGFIMRSKQVDFLAKHIAKSPHPVIVSGDLNELPYSYPYIKLRRLLSNAFEKKGQGFGFTYNGKLFFLRIDHQFFSDQLEIHNYTTHREAKESDHFPISARYSLK